MLRVEQIYVEGWDKNFSYLLYEEGSREAAVIDPNGRVERILEAIERKGLRLRYLINTHSHRDHIEHNDLFRERFSLRCAMHVEEPYSGREVAFQDGERWSLGGEFFTFLHTPGHTPGSSCILAGDSLISGDTLFVGRCGRTTFAGGSAEQMFDSMQRLRRLPPQTRIFPGHHYGQWPTSTIEKELTYNRCLRCTRLEEFLELGI
ncbi:MAG: MBL fold metallo-hydrolase [Planctomycetota bacterium]|nr:MAG: MBL fold metallo-hydrolase [Planctomycetota bacterium]